MVRKNLVFMIAVLLACTMTFIVSCARQQKVKTESGERVGATTGQMEEEEIRMELERAKDAFVNEDVRFDFDQSVLTAEARRILDRKVSWLRSNPEAVVTIEGHCDERGTTEYNIALGERRALSAKGYLEDMGIESSRMIPVTYGEEQPLDPGHNEAAWAKNRRANFAVR